MTRLGGDHYVRVGRAIAVRGAFKGGRIHQGAGVTRCSNSVRRQRRMATSSVANFARIVWRDLGILSRPLGVRENDHFADESRESTLGRR